MDKRSGADRRLSTSNTAFMHSIALVIKETKLRVKNLRTKRCKHIVVAVTDIGPLLIAYIRDEEHTNSRVSNRQRERSGSQ